MDDSHIPLVAVATAVGVVLGKLLDSGVRVLDAWYANRGKARAVQFGEQSVIIDRQEKQIARLEAQIHEQQEAIRLMQQEHSQCREESAQLRIWLAMLREDMIRGGLQPRDLPDLARYESQHGTDVGFVVRQTEQSTNLLKRVDEQIKHEPPAGGGHADSDH